MLEMLYSILAKNMIFYSDFSEPYQILFQDPATPMMNGILELHHYIFMYLIAILIFVMVTLFFVTQAFGYQYNVYNLDFDIADREKKNLGYKRRWYTYFFYKKSLFYGQVLAPKDDGKKRIASLFLKKVASRSYWNSFWNSVNLQGNAFFTKPYYNLKGLSDVALIWTIPVSRVSNFSVGLVENVKTNDGFNKGLVDQSLGTESAFVSAIFMKLFSYSKPFFFISPMKGKQIYGQRYVPKASRKKFIKYVLCYTDYEFACIFNPYIINTIYWIQTYIFIKSGISKFTHNTVIEIVWTIIPSLILVFIGIPSFILLYAMDEIIEPDFIIKCIGHQWYWSYEVEYPNFSENGFLKTANLSSIELMLKVLAYQGDFTGTNIAVSGIPFEDKFFDLLEGNKVDAGLLLELDNQAKGMSQDVIYRNFTSYMINEGDLETGKLRLLEVDNPLFIPQKTHIDLLITANDVLHSWSVPSFGVKFDAVPGRLNHANLFVERTGVFYGQCSELCGVNHGFMPIKVIVESIEDFLRRS